MTVPMGNRHTSHAAFTMIELVFIIVILGILASIAVPKMAASREDALYSAYRTDLVNIDTALRAHYIATGAPAKTIGELPIELSGVWTMRADTPLKNQNMLRIVRNDSSGNRLTCVEVQLVGVAAPGDENYIIGFPPAGKDKLCDRLYDTIAAQGLELTQYQGSRYFKHYYKNLVKSVQF
ncbi:MAG: type II secretion system protein [Wolinella sp.]